MIRIRNKRFTVLLILVILTNIACSIGIASADVITYASTGALENPTISITNGTTEDNAIAALDSTVEVLGSYDETGTAEIAWTIDAYNASTAGNYSATGILTLPTGWTGIPGYVTAIVTVQSLEPATVTPEPTEPVTITYAITGELAHQMITVANGETEVDAIAALDPTVEVLGSSDEFGTAAIEWTIDGYNANMAGDYRATGLLTLPAGWTGTPANVTAIVTVQPAEPMTVTAEPNLVFSDQDGDYSFEVIYGEAQITEYTGPGGDVRIPSTLGGLPVTSIGKQAFYCRVDITGIYIPEGITSIGFQAFELCGLVEINFPSTLTNIRNGAFSGCSRLTHVSIPQGVTSIGDDAFSNCSNLTNVNIGKGLSEVGWWPFSACFKLISISVDAANPNYTSLEGVLYNKDLTVLVICPDGLAAVTIPDSVREIGWGAFHGCRSIKNITLPPNLEYINAYAFHDSGLREINIPNSVLGVGGSAFDCCWSLESATFNSATTNIVDSWWVFPFTTIIGYDPSTAKDWATKYGRTFQAIETSKTLDSIAITTPANKLSYSVGDNLDLTGLVVTGTYSDGTTEIETITAANVTGFDSSAANQAETLTITYGGKTTTYVISVNAVHTGGFDFYPNQYSKDLAIRLAYYCMVLDDEEYPVDIPYLNDYLADDSFVDAQDYNFEQDDSGVNKVAYVIAHRKVNYHGVVRNAVVVVIRGTHGNEWYGNMQITGSRYEPKAGGHTNWYSAMNDVYSNLELYLKNYELDEPLLLITGHSRGAAVANILADSLDAPNNDPVFNNSEIFAYTFATPNTNLSKYAYNDENIFNFCFSDDFVTQMPLEKWGWARNGITRTANAEESYKNNSEFKRHVDATTLSSKNPVTGEITFHYDNHFNSDATKTLLSNILSHWSSAKDYYNKRYNMVGVTGDKHKQATSLYAFMILDVARAADDGGFWFSRNDGYNTLKNLAKNKRDKIWSPIAEFFVNGINQYYITDTHDMHTYLYAIQDGCFAE